MRQTDSGLPAACEARAIEPASRIDAVDLPEPPLLDVTVIVFAEGTWTMEEPNELDLYGETFGTAQGEIRWDLVAEGLGCHG